MTAGSERALADFVREHARRAPDSPCISFGGATMSFQEVDRRSSRVANALVAAGVGSGDRVAILARNTPVFFEAAFGASKVNAVLMALNWRLAAPEIDAIIADAGPALVLVSRDLLHLLPAPLREGTADARLVILDDQYEPWLAGVADADPGRSGGPDDVVLMLYTSGTTGLPKGVMLTNHNMSFTPDISRVAWGFGVTSVNLVAMPLFHVGGIGWGLNAMVHGGHTVIVNDPTPSTVFRAIQDYRVTNAFFVPAVIQTLVNDEALGSFDLSSLDLIVYGASPISDATLRRALEALQCRFSQAYGMTETAGTVVSLPPADHDPGGPREYLLRSCGRALPWIELMLADPATHQPVTTGKVGEIWVRSGQVTPGYRNKPAATAEAITETGWLRTGDAAYQDAEGYIYLYDRFKDMIVSGAENVYPAEVENVLYDHPAVSEVAVIGVPSERWGETVKAIVVLEDGAGASEAELIEFARSRLARYKCPTSVEFRDSLPRNPSGKVLKKDLRAPYWEGDRHIN
ncbi:MAG: fatty acid--CoA ligase [Candidatus Dormibacteria bacterium]